MTDYKEMRFRFPIRGLASDPLPQEVVPGNEQPGTGEWHQHDQMHVLDRRIWKYLGWERWSPLACPTITLEASLPTLTIGQFYQGLVTASGGLAPYTFEIIDGELPLGLTLDAATGVISGWPAVYYCPLSDGIGGELV